MTQLPWFCYTNHGLTMVIVVKLSICQESWDTLGFWLVSLWNTEWLKHLYTIFKEIPLTTITGTDVRDALGWKQTIQMK